MAQANTMSLETGSSHTTYIQISNTQRGGKFRSMTLPQIKLDYLKNVKPQPGV